MKPRKAVEHRAPDQDAAVEAAFVAGVLPEEDRRASEVPAPEPVEEVIEPSPPVRDLSRAHERVPNDAGSFDYFTESGEKL